MDAISDPGTEEVVIMSAAQVGKSECLLNTIGRTIDRDPAPILFIMPTAEMAQAMSKDRIAPMIRDTPCLRNKVADPRSRDSGNTALHKVFPGGHLTLAGSNSSASLSARPVRYVLLDEVSRYPESIAGEGSPILLAKKRAVSFFNKKIVQTSTPTVRGSCAIEKAYEDSDKRRYYVPCPHCSHYQTLEWSMVVWDEKKPETARIRCKECEKDWSEPQRIKSIQKGEWRATEGNRAVAGFHIPGLLSSFITPAQAAVEFTTVKDHPEQLRTWVNTFAGETFEDAGDVIDHNSVMERREEYDGEVPDGVLVLTLACDVQKDRLEILVMGHGVDDEKWMVSGDIIWGDPSEEFVWNELRKIIQRPWSLHNGKEIAITASFVDSGYLTPQVYKFCKQMQPFRVLQPRV